MGGGRGRSSKNRAALPTQWHLGLISIALGRRIMQSAIKQWQVALQRAQAIQPLGKLSHSGDDFNLDALLDADNSRRLEHVRRMFWFCFMLFCRLNHAVSCRRVLQLLTGSGRTKLFFSACTPQQCAWTWCWRAAPAPLYL